MGRDVTHSAHHEPAQQDGKVAWREEVKAELARKLEAGRTLCVYREDGAWVQRTKEGDTVIEPPKKEASSYARCKVMR